MKFLLKDLKKNIGIRYNQRLTSSYIRLTFISTFLDTKTKQWAPIAIQKNL